MNEFILLGFPITILILSGVGAVLAHRSYKRWKEISQLVDQLDRDLDKLGREIEAATGRKP
jgi:hypothetical protein